MSLGGTESGGDGLYERLGTSFSGTTAQLTIGKSFDSDVCPSLTIKQRMYGFAACFVAGWFIAFLSVIALPDIRKNPARFAILYTAGNLIALASTAFLWGPMRQLRRMLEKKRIIATLMYIGSMILTLVLAFTKQSAFLVLFSILLQFIAMIWYCLSYIPYARAIVKKIFCKCFGASSSSQT